MPQQYMTAQEVSELLRVKPCTLSKRRSQNRPPKYCKAGGRILYTQEAIDEFLEVHGGSND